MKPKSWIRQKSPFHALNMLANFDITVVKSIKELKKGLEHFHNHGLASLMKSCEEHYGRQVYWQLLHVLSHQKLAPIKIQSYGLLQTRKRNGGEDWIIEVSF